MNEKLEELKAVLEDKNNICVIGHDNIDADSVLSGILLARLLNFLGKKATFKILQPVKEDETYRIIKELFDIDIKQFEAPENETRNLFLVDHYETKHLGEVVGCIDHHPTKKENSYDFSYVRASTAAAYQIYELMQKAGYKISNEEAKMIVSAMMVDTASFKSAKTIPSEVSVAKQLSQDHRLDYDYLEKYCACLTEIESMNIDQITSNGIKKYEFNNNRVESAYVQIDIMPDNQELNKWLNHLYQKVVDQNLAMFVFIIFDMSLGITHEYDITVSDIKEFTYNGILSRGLNIMPLIEELYHSGKDDNKAPNLVRTLKPKDLQNEEN